MPENDGKQSQFYEILREILLAGLVGLGFQFTRGRAAATATTAAGGTQSAGSTAPTIKQPFAAGFMGALGFQDETNVQQYAVDIVKSLGKGDDEKGRKRWVGFNNYLKNELGPGQRAKLKKVLANDFSDTLQQLEREFEMIKKKDENAPIVTGALHGKAVELMTAKVESYVILAEEKSLKDVLIAQGIISGFDTRGKAIDFAKTVWGLVEKEVNETKLQWNSLSQESDSSDDAEQPEKNRKQIFKQKEQLSILYRDVSKLIRKLPAGKDRSDYFKKVKHIRTEKDQAKAIEAFQALQQELQGGA